MGKVVAFSSFESRREKMPSGKSGNQSGKILMYTGIRYERMGPAKENKTEIETSRARGRGLTNRTAARARPV